MSGLRKESTVRRLQRENRALRSQLEFERALGSVQQRVNEQLKAAHDHMAQIFVVKIGPSPVENATCLRFDHHFGAADVRPGNWDALRPYAHAILDYALGDFEVKRGFKEITTDLGDVRARMDAYKVKG